MKEQAVRIGRTWVLGAILFAGMAYAVLALSNPTAAFASSCNCNEERIEANGLCAPYGGVYDFICPVNDGTAGSGWVAECWNPYYVFGEDCSVT
jgi:hypothetical protein